MRVREFQTQESGEARHRVFVGRTRIPRCAKSFVPRFTTTTSGAYEKSQLLVGFRSERAQKERPDSIRRCCRRSRNDHQSPTEGIAAWSAPGRRGRRAVSERLRLRCRREAARRGTENAIAERHRIADELDEPIRRRRGGDEGAALRLDSMERSWGCRPMPPSAW